MILADDVLSKSNRTNCMNLLNSEKFNHFFPTKTTKKAAVLVPLCKINDEVGLLYTVRALHLKVNGGDMAFPGGMYNESDGTLENTALRETEEEIGLHPNKVDIWGKGPEINRSDVKVTPILAYIGQLNQEDLKINSNEVSAVVPVTLEKLSSREHFGSTKFRRGKTYIFQTPVYLGASKRIWGLTAYITHIVLSSLIPQIYNSNISYNPVILKRIAVKTVK